MTAKKQMNKNRTNVRFGLYFLEGLWYTIIQYDYGKEE